MLDDLKLILHHMVIGNTQTAEVMLGELIDEQESAGAQALDRIEAKLDALIAALAEDEAEEPGRTLDGDLFGGERDQTQSLG